MSYGRSAIVRRGRRVAIAFGMAVCLGTGLTINAAAAPTTQTHVTGESVTAPAWQVQSKLDAIANALSSEGRGAYADAFSNLYVNIPHNQVTLYATDAARAAQLIAAAKHSHPKINTSLVRYVHADFTWAEISSKISSIMTADKAVSASAETIYSAAEAPNGNGILVSAKTSATSALRTKIARTMTQGPAIPVTITAGSPVAASSWRWNDTKPFIGGDVLIGNLAVNLTLQCTGGIAAEDSSGNDYLLTAAHCFADTNAAFGDGYTTGNFDELKFGNRVGEVVDQADEYDSEAISTGSKNGAGSNSDEADQPQGKYYPVPSYVNEYNGDSVCMDGARWYYTYGGVRCGTTITNDNAEYNETWDNGSVHTVVGEEVYRSGNPWIAGDSGGLVFTICGSNCRDAAGQVSALLTSNNNYGYIVTAYDILNNYRFVINPHT